MHHRLLAPPPHSRASRMKYPTRSQIIQFSCGAASQRDKPCNLNLSPPLVPLCVSTLVTNLIDCLIYWRRSSSICDLFSATRDITDTNLSYDTCSGWVGRPENNVKGNANQFNCAGHSSGLRSILPHPQAQIRHRQIWLQVCGKTPKVF